MISRSRRRSGLAEDGELRGTEGDEAGGYIYRNEILGCSLRGAAQ